MKTLACRLVLLLALLSLAPAALALGLGQIEVKSRAGQPLLAEIPIISTDPSELENLQARLASPETFRRIGLEPPTGLVSDLRFTIALDPRGRPVIRITTQAPVQQPVLGFLVEVDWGQGRLVREYSALVDTPQTVAAPAQPPIQAPQAAPSNLIERPAEASAPERAVADGQASEADADAEAAPAATQAEAEADTSGETEAAPPAVAEQPAAPAPPPAAPAPASPAVPPGDYGPVQRGQTLSEIAASLSAGGGHSLNQVMLALLRANPEAFIGGNINLIRQGAVLRVPAREQWSEASIAEANAVVREHVSRWREMRRPVPQPAATVDADAVASAAAAPVAGSDAPRVADARLEIVPPSAGAGQDAGTRTGTAAGGEGDMLQQQELIQTRETLAARDAEVQDLKARVAELEQLQQQQQQLIQMKDSELANAQARLAQSNRQPAPTLAQAEVAQPAPEAGADAAGAPWMWIGLGLLALALLAWWLLSRRKGADSARRRPGYGFTSAAAFPNQASAARPAPAPARPEPRAAPETAPEPAPAAKAETGTQQFTVEREGIAAGWSAAPAAATGGTPTWHAAGAGGAEQAATVAPLNPAPAGQERIELARAYLDLGDVDTARTLLQEVAEGGDAGARGEAERLLRELA